MWSRQLLCEALGPPGLLSTHYTVRERQCVGGRGVTAYGRAAVCRRGLREKEEVEGGVAILFPSEIAW